MRRAIAVVLLAACGRSAPPPAEPLSAGTTEPAPAARRTPRPPPPRRAPAPADALPAPTPEALDHQVAILRELIRDTGDPLEALELTARLYETLDRHPDPARRAEALTVAAELVASPTFVRLTMADRVLYGYGAGLQQAGRPADARAVWQRLLRAYPQSAFVPDVQLGLGEAAFNDGDLAAAEALYQEAARATEARVRDYARYKLAWTHLNLGRADDALAGFLAVATSASDPLRREARKDLVRAYAEAGRADRALAFFQRVDRVRAGELTLALADRYVDLGKGADAAIAYRAAMPALDDTGVCRAGLGLVTAANLLGRRADLLAALTTLAAGPHPGDCGAEAEALAFEIALTWHREHQALRNDPADVIAAWTAAESLARTDDHRRQAAQARAQLTARAAP